jgi:hypothetical protein
MVLQPHLKCAVGVCIPHDSSGGSVQVNALYHRLVKAVEGQHRLQPSQENYSRELVHKADEPGIMDSQGAARDVAFPQQHENPVWVTQHDAPSTWMKDSAYKVSASLPFNAQKPDDFVRRATEQPGAAMGHHDQTLYGALSRALFKEKPQIEVCVCVCARARVCVRASVRLCVCACRSHR